MSSPIRDPVMIKVACEHAPGPGLLCVNCLRTACLQIEVPETAEAQSNERGLTGALTTIGELQDLLALVRTERDGLRVAFRELRRAMVDALLARTSIVDDKTIAAVDEHEAPPSSGVLPGSRP